MRIFNKKSSESFSSSISYRIHFWILSKRSIRKKKSPLEQGNSGTRSDNDYYFLFRLEERIFPGWLLKLFPDGRRERLLLTLSGSVWGFIGRGQMKESMWEYMFPTSSKISQANNSNMPAPWYLFQILKWLLSLQWILLWIQPPPILPSSCQKGTDV